MQCLPGLVDTRAQEASIQYSQRPQLDILSDDPWNIGHVDFPASPPGTGPVTRYIQFDTVPEILRFQVQFATLDAASAIVTASEGKAGDAALKETDTQLRSSDRQNADVELERTGIAVYGARIARVVGAPASMSGCRPTLPGRLRHPPS